MLFDRHCDRFAGRWQEHRGDVPALEIEWKVRRLNLALTQKESVLKDLTYHGVML